MDCKVSLVDAERITEGEGGENEEWDVEEWMGWVVECVVVLI